MKDLEEYTDNYQYVLANCDTKKLSEEQTLAYINRLHDNRNDKVALTALFNANILFATSKAFQRKLLSRDDAFSAASEGLINALNKVEPERILQISAKYNRGINASFLTFASGFIRDALNLATNEYSPIPTSEYERKNIAAVRAAYREVMETYGDTLSHEEVIYEVSYRTFLNERQVQVALDSSAPCASLDMEIKDNDNQDSSMCLKDSLEDTQQLSAYEQYWRKKFIEDIHIAVDELPDTLRDIVLQFTGLNGEEPVSAPKIAAQYDRSRMWVYNQLDVAYGILKERQEDFFSYYIA